MTNTNARNKRLYEKKITVSEYAQTKLHTTEMLIFIKYREWILRKTILDIGCGAGRTTLPLKNIGECYTGIDYSLDMIDVCKKRFPNARFLHADVRNMGIFKDKTFDFVLFSYNGLDSISHEDRVKGLREIRRVLKHDGLFVFSSHNRNCRFANSRPTLPLALSPWVQVPSLLNYIRSSYNYARNKKQEHFEEEYAIINDKAHNFSLLTYYIDQKHQVSQLKKMGLEVIEMYDPYGNLLKPGDDDSNSAWIYYVTRQGK
ncbi:MAG: class I SAM-dependent methyltransferase [Candidatus Brocadiaceae bacterium]|nr:class I SAM-dependent methyltransferase [Candidatus Brocadiaceae bacterium]